MFINFTNHTSKLWDKAQLEAAKEYGEIVDLGYPNVSPGSTREEVYQLGEECYRRIMEYQPSAVLCQGEYTLVCYLVRRLQESRVLVLAACTQRSCYMVGNEKRSVFEFVQFREY